MIVPSINKPALLYTYKKILNLCFPSELCSFITTTEKALHAEQDWIKKIAYQELISALPDIFFRTVIIQEQFYSQISALSNNPFNNKICPPTQAPSSYIKDLSYELLKKENDIYAQNFSKFSSYSTEWLSNTVYRNSIKM